MSTNNKYNPTTFTHPGFILKEKLLEMDMNAREFAIRVDKPEKTISKVINGKSSITPEMAVLFENALRIPAKFWLNLQTLYNESIARANQKEVLKSEAPWAKKFPYKEMAERGWVPQCNDNLERIQHLLEFFRISGSKAWEQYFIANEAVTSFRISLKSAKNPYAVSAWLRQGEIEAETMEVPVFSKAKFREIIKEIKCLVQNQPQDFFLQLKSLCASAGVKLIYTPCLPQAPISGCTRWIKKSPVIQLSGRYKKNDIFWFTFFHEVGHILLHGQTEIFIDDGNKDEKENEADNYASNQLLSKSQRKELFKAYPLSDNDVLAIAKKFNTHPGIVVGCLHHEFKDFSYGRKFQVNIELD